jgi:putative PIN family toxin of toxin-antitoxin system
MERFFIDTNVLVSGLLWDGNERRVLALAKSGAVRAVTSQYVLDEAAHVLRDYFKLEEAWILAQLGDVAGWFSEIIEVNKGEVISQAKKVSDKKDAAILAGAAKSKAVLVTGDKKLARDAKSAVKAMSPAELLAHVGDTNSG